MPIERFDFPNREGVRLAARLELPDGAPRAYALFAHCFTCGKDTVAAGRIARALVGRGIAVLRFDFTGLGASEGDFANTNFSSNIADLVAAADALRRRDAAPQLLIGHSFGGAAVLAAAAEIAEARAVVTIGAPSDPAHVAGLLADGVAAIARSGEASVKIGERVFQVRQQFLDDIAASRQIDRLGKLRQALLVMHAPTDAVVGIDHAARIFTAARHPKSFISLDDADHLLSRGADADYAAAVIAAWAGRYLEPGAQPNTMQPNTMQPARQAGPGEVLVTATGNGKFQQRVTVGRHAFLADEPVDVGGGDSGPGPYDLLLAALGACTAMTLRLYADGKQWPLDGVAVTLRHDKIHAADCAECETREGKIDLIEREIAIEGSLDPAQRARLMEIADKCPVHRTLHAEVAVRTREVPPRPAG